MPGLHVVISDSLPDDIRTILQDTLFEDFFELSVLLTDSKKSIAVSSYEEYPYDFWQENSCSILVEGMIYNYTDTELKRELNHIAEQFMRREDAQSLIRAFVERADGDYIVLIHTPDNRVLVFNDYFGRLPLYYFCASGLCVISREIKTVLSFIPKITIHKVGLVEFLMYEHTMGSKTIFKDVYRLQPSNIMEIVSEPHVSLERITQSAEFDCVLRSPFKSTRESLLVLRDKFLESTENRVKAIHRNNVQIIADLSGGFDSRTILAGLQKFTKDVTYLSINLSTNLPGKDETERAEMVFEMMGSPGKLIKIHNDNDYEYDIKNLGGLIYNTDGLVNYHTTYTCYVDIHSMKRLVPNKAFRMPGLGGSDFIRKSPQLFYRSIMNGLEKGYYARSELSPQMACKLAGISFEDYRQEAWGLQSALPEKAEGDQLKRFYFDYQNHYAYGAPEDRERFHFWTAPPMCGLPFLRTILSRFPNEWSSQGYYIEFMRMLDPRLLEVPLYGNSLNMHSAFEIKRRALRAKLTLLKKGAIIRQPILGEIWKWFVGEHKPGSLPSLDIIHDMGSSLMATRSIIEPSLATEHLMAVPDGQLMVRIITLYMYFAELEKRFAHKILVEC